MRSVQYGKAVSFQYLFSLSFVYCIKLYDQVFLGRISIFGLVISKCDHLRARSTNMNRLVSSVNKITLILKKRN